MPRLFAVLLGGHCAPRSNTELHDVVFAVGDRLEDTYPQLLELWFGTPAGLHIDSWLELRVIDGHRVVLDLDAPQSDRHLYFINLGGYRDGDFAEHHANLFLVARDEQEAKQRAKATLLRGFDSVHTDDLYAVDDILQVKEVGGWHVTLEPSDEPPRLQPNNGYRPLPEELIAAYQRRRRP
ncbi:MAG: DUF1543 domain-containing protein [Candidatus Krumholzibacteriia bacterium]